MKVETLNIRGLYWGVFAEKNGNRMTNVHVRLVWLVCECRLHSFGLGEVPVAGSCGNCSEPTGYQSKFVTASHYTIEVLMEYKYWNTDEHQINVWFPKIYYEYSSTIYINNLRNKVSTHTANLQHWNM